MGKFQNTQRGSRYRSRQISSAVTHHQDTMCQRKWHPIEIFIRERISFYEERHPLQLQSILCSPQTSRNKQHDRWLLANDHGCTSCCAMSRLQGHSRTLWLAVLVARSQLGSLIGSWGCQVTKRMQAFVGNKAPLICLAFSEVHKGRTKVSALIFHKA